MNVIVRLFFLFAIGVANAVAEPLHRPTQNTVALAPGQQSPPATLATMRWLEGQWVGEAFGGIAEEVWLAPNGGSMPGMYRIVRDGKPWFFELMTIVEERGTIVLRLKHFNADLTGWEEKDEVVEFPLVAIEPDAVHFDAMSFHPKGEAMTIFLAIRQKDGTVTEQRFEYKRVAAPRA